MCSSDLLTVVGAGGTILLAISPFFGNAAWIWIMVMYLIANVGLNGAGVFYNALLPHLGEQEELDDIQTIDGNGLFIMPGMVEAHAHISYSNSGPLELDKAPVEESMIKTIGNARLMLGSGFTSAISFGSVHKIDVFLKEAIERGEIPGPRLLAGSKDISATGGNSDFYPDNVQIVPEGLGMIRNGPWELRTAVRQLWKNGAEIVKVMIDGEIISLQGRPGDLGLDRKSVV